MDFKEIIFNNEKNWDIKLCGAEDKKALVVLSGGLDSSVLLTWAKKYFKDIEAVSFDFHQKYILNTDPKNILFQNNIVELECAKKLTQKLNVKHTIIDVSFMSNILKEMQNRKDEFNANMLNNTEQPKTNMPFRNLMLLSMALSVAELAKCDCILTGYQTQDAHGYWDTTLEFVEGINRVAKLNPKCKIVITAPFSSMNKHQEIMLGIKEGVDFANTWSCYNPLWINNEYICCNECPACKDRKMNFEKLNLKDPLKYYEKGEK